MPILGIDAGSIEKCKNEINSLRTLFNERDTENPEIRDMFKALGIIEYFGTGIGEAKRALEENGYPTLFYKVFGNSRIVDILGCSEATATAYIKKLHDGLHIINAVEGSGKGKYVFGK